MTEHEVFVAARNLLDGGWTQGRLRRPRIFRSSAYCAVGAINMAATGKAYELPERGLDRALWLAFFDANVVGLMGFNDAPGRTKDEVLAAFDRAIAATAPPPADPFDGAVPGLEPKAEASGQEPVSALLEEPKEAA